MDITGTRGAEPGGGRGAPIPSVRGQWQSKGSLSFKECAPTESEALKALELPDVVERVRAVFGTLLVGHPENGRFNWSVCLDPHDRTDVALLDVR